MSVLRLSLKVIFVLVLAFSYSACESVDDSAAVPPQLSYELLGNVKLNTIHDGYYSEFSGYVKIVESLSCIAFHVCSDVHRTHSVEEQFENRVVFKRGDGDSSTFLIPLSSLEPEVSAYISDS